MVSQVTSSVYEEPDLLASAYATFPFHFASKRSFQAFGFSVSLTSFLLYMMT